MFADQVIMSAAIEQNRNGVEVRISNTSETDFDRVVVVFPEQGQVDYGAVRKGGLSQFRTTKKAYRYAGIRVKIGQRELTLNPIDYVGEKPLEPGRYTYVLGLNGEQLTLSLEPAR